MQKEFKGIVTLFYEILLAGSYWEKSSDSGLASLYTINNQFVPPDQLDEHAVQVAGFDGCVVYCSETPSCKAFYFQEDQVGAQSENCQPYEELFVYVLPVDPNLIGTTATP